MSGIEPRRFGATVRFGSDDGSNKSSLRIYEFQTEAALNAFLLGLSKPLDYAVQTEPERYAFRFGALEISKWATYKIESQVRHGINSFTNFIETK